MPIVLARLVLVAELGKQAWANAAEPGAQIHVQLLQLARRACAYQSMQARLERVEAGVRSRVQAQVSGEGDVVRKEWGAVASVLLQGSEKCIRGCWQQRTACSATLLYTAHRCDAQVSSEMSAAPEMLRSRRDRRVRTLATISGMQRCSSIGLYTYSASVSQSKSKTLTAHRACRTVQRRSAEAKKTAELRETAPTSPSSKTGRRRAWAMLALRSGNFLRLDRSTATSFA